MPTEESFKAFKIPDDTAEGRILVGIHCYFTRDNISERFELIRRYSKIYKLLIGEYGFVKDTEEREKITEEFLAYADEFGIPAIWWDEGNLSKYGLVNRETLEWPYKDILRLITGK